MTMRFSLVVVVLLSFALMVFARIGGEQMEMKSNEIVNGNKGTVGDQGMEYVLPSFT